MFLTGWRLVAGVVVAGFVLYTIVNGLFFYDDPTWSLFKRIAVSSFWAFVGFFALTALRWAETRAKR